MKAKKDPCEGEHDFYENYYEGGYCGVPLCDGGCTGHCKKCGWYISECPCASQNGCSKISPRQEKAIQKRKKK